MFDALETGFEERKALNRKFVVFQCVLFYLSVSYYANEDTKFIDNRETTQSKTCVDSSQGFRLQLHFGAFFKDLKRRYTLTSFAHFISEKWWCSTCFIIIQCGALHSVKSIKYLRYQV